MSLSQQVKDFALTLEVYQTGLKLGLIPREEIVAWADQIIVNSDEPDYFFIELSLSSDVNRLIEVLNENVVPTDNPICGRVILGLIYHRQSVFDVDKIDQVATMVGRLSSLNTLTFFEKDIIYMFDDYDIYYSTDSTQLQVELINFLSFYEAFTLENHKQWVEINEQVLILLKEEEIRDNKVNESLRKVWAKKEKKRKLIFHLKKAGAIILLLVFFSLVIALLNDGKTNHFTSYFIMSYFCLKLLYTWWTKRK